MFGGFGHRANMGAGFSGLDVADGVVKLVVISPGSVRGSCQEDLWEIMPAGEALVLGKEYHLCMTGKQKKWFLVNPRHSFIFVA